MILLEIAPLLVLLGLLASGRVTPITACCGALLASLPALLALQGAGLGGFLLRESLLAAFLAMQPVAVVAGGLLFHAAVSAPGPAEARPISAARIFAVSLPLGVFLESVTGFSVGAVFALSALRSMGVRGAVAAALAVQALTMVPWGGLGPGTSLGSAIAGVAPQEVARIAAWPTMLWLLLLAPLLWRFMAMAGAAADGREKWIQFGLLALLGALLLLANALGPFEVAGVIASGIVTVLALWRADPPDDLRRALRAASPYLLLVAALLAARLWPQPPGWKPFAAFPAFPITHVAVVLLLVALGVMLARGRLGEAPAALRRAARPALAMLLYVLLGRWLAGSGIAAGLAEDLAHALGPAAPYAILPMAVVSGVITGTNVGSNAALMPVQAALGQEAGLSPALVAGLHNFGGGAGAGMGASGLAMLCGLLADGTRPAAIWRLLLPSILAVLFCGTLALVVLR